MSRLTELLDVDGMKIKTAKERPLSNQGLGEILWKLYDVEDLMEKYELEDLTDLEIALDYYYHRFDGVHTERVDNK